MNIKTVQNISALNFQCNGKPILLPFILADLKAEGKSRFDFGTFRLKTRTNARFHNVHTGEVKKTNPYNAVFFKASKSLKRAVRHKK